MKFLPKIVFLGAFAAAGCESTLRGQPDTHYTIGGALGDRPTLESIVFEKRLSKTAVTNALDSQTRFTRNSVIFARVAEIDALYNAYETGILTESRGTDFVLSVGTLAAGLLGGFTTGFTSQIYSLIGGGIGAVQTSYDKEILAESTVQAFISQMRANRSKVLSEIYANLQADHTIYPIEAALGDLQRYRQAGTLAAAIVGISEQAQLAERREGEVARDRGKDLFKGSLPDAIEDQEIILRLLDYTKDATGLDKYIVEANKFGAGIGADGNRRLDAVNAISVGNVEVNRVIAERLGLI